ncbi:GUN4 domain-containing protein [Calothrix membranacea FACHB-236]|nr:GUN4 domain-containing protein [Calothrix membranacea FACHB-236]
MSTATEIILNYLKIFINSTHSFCNVIEDYKLFGHRVGWLVNLVNTEWRKYEDAIFSLDAPEGHLPYTIRVLGLGYRNPGEIPHRLKRFLPRY